MPESEKYTVSHKELAQLILKSANVHEGQWMLTINFSFGPGNFGPSDDQLSPGLAIGVQQVGIQRINTEQIPPGTILPNSLIVDANEVNPRPSGASKSPKA
jgi:hypothetical protein